MNVFTPTIATDKAAQKLVRKWIKALRSGKYAQGTSALQNRGGFCCLGVMCDLTAPSEWTKTSGNDFPLIHSLGSGYLTTEGQRLVRLSDAGMRTLAALNDGAAYRARVYSKSSFKEIAARLSSDLNKRIATGGPVIDSRP